MISIVAEKDEKKEDIVVPVGTATERDSAGAVNHVGRGLSSDLRQESGEKWQYRSWCVADVNAS